MLLVIFGCGAASNECPRSVALASEMRAVRERAGRAAANNEPSTSSPHVWNQPYGGQTWYPWFYYWDPDLEHARLLAAGIQEGGALELEYRAACNEMPERVQARSALDTYAIDARRLRDGMLVHLAESVGPPEALLVALRCHRTWLRLLPRGEAHEDLLALDGIKVVVHAGARDGVDVLFSSDDLDILTEIERRARIAVARATRLRAMQPLSL